jgi:hypothetical protein
MTTSLPAATSQGKSPHFTRMLITCLFTDMCSQFLLPMSICFVVVVAVYNVLCQVYVESLLPGVRIRVTAEQSRSSKVIVVLLCCDCSNRICKKNHHGCCLHCHSKMHFFSCGMLFGFAFCDLVPDSCVEFRVTGEERSQAMLCGCLFSFFSIYKWVKVLKEDLISIRGRSWEILVQLSKGVEVIPWNFAMAYVQM